MVLKLLENFIRAKYKLDLINRAMVDDRGYQAVEFHRVSSCSPPHKDRPA